MPFGGISANLGTLFREHRLEAAVAAAGRAGFAAVECHWPHALAPEALRAAVRAAGLALVSLNTRPGARGLADFGTAALPGRAGEARAEIAVTVDYAARAGARAVHVMAGRTDGGAAAEAAYRDALRLACDLAAPRGLTVLIEPINRRDVPGYHLASLAQALETVAALDLAPLRVMVDTYHMGRMGEDPAAALRRAAPVLGHVQIAADGDRGEPDTGAPDVASILATLDDIGFDGYMGAEYRPRGPSTEAGLGWLAPFARRGRPRC